MIAQLLPAQVATAYAVVDVAEEGPSSSENVSLGSACESRRREFATGRRCAREALVGLGVGPAPVLRGPAGEPRWPAGVVGSITHCRGYRAAAVARVGEVRALGVDAEPHEPAPEGVLDVIADAREREQVTRLGRDRPEVHWDRLLFSIKESVYKAWFPLTQRWLGFSGATVTVDPDRATFVARLTVPGPRLRGSRLTAFEGRWLVQDGLVLTAVVA